MLIKHAVLPSKVAVLFLKLINDLCRIGAQRLISFATYDLLFTDTTRM